MKMFDFIEIIKNNWEQHTGKRPEKIVLPSSMYRALRIEAIERSQILAQKEFSFREICGVEVIDSGKNSIMNIR